MQLAEAALYASLADETPEGKSIVALVERDRLAAGGWRRVVGHVARESVDAAVLGFGLSAGLLLGLIGALPYADVAPPAAA